MADTTSRGFGSPNYDEDTKRKAQSKGGKQSHSGSSSNKSAGKEDRRHQNPGRPRKSESNK